MEIVSIPVFLEYHEKVRARTLRVARAFLPEQLEWAPRPGAFTAGDLLRHIASTERYMFAENVAGRPSSYPGHGRELADGHEAVLAYLDTTHQEAVDIIRSLGAEDLNQRCMTPAGASMPVWKWLRAMIEHEIHHRGQLYSLLGLLDVPAPPLYGLTSEQVKERSVSLSGLVPPP